jgi:hypothetical protein
VGRFAVKLTSKDTTARPDTPNSTGEAVSPVGTVRRSAGANGLGVRLLAPWLDKTVSRCRRGRRLEGDAVLVFVTSRGWPRVVTL